MRATTRAELSTQKTRAGGTTLRLHVSRLSSTHVPTALLSPQPLLRLGSPYPFSRMLSRLHPRPSFGDSSPPFRGTLSESFAEYVQKEKIFMNSEVTTGYILAAILVAAGITFLLRLLPFGLKKALAGSELLDALSHWIPLGAVALLAIYAVAKINYSSFATAAPYLAGLVVTVGVHLWRKNMVLSMVAGTVTCVVLANWVF